MPRLALLTPLFALAACANRPPPPDWPISEPAELCANPALEPGDFCMPVERLETWLKAPVLDITHSATTATGLTAPKKLRVKTQEGLAFNVKFKPVPEDLDNFNNSPRRELAAYQIQRLFLDTDEYVVPPTVLRCLPVEKHRSVIEGLEPFRDSDCSLGVVSYWIENISSDDLVDKVDWITDRTYRDSLANLNILTVLIGHQDDVGDNFYRSGDEERPRVVSIDNGLSLGAMGINPFQLVSSSWSELQVPSIPEPKAKRLRELTPDDLARLYVVAEIEKRGDGWRVLDSPSREPLEPEEGVRTRDDLIQLGLNEEELASMRERLHEMLAELRRRKIGTHPPSTASAR